MWSISDQLLMVHMGAYLSDCYSYLGESYGIWGLQAVAVCHRMTTVTRRREYTQKKPLVQTSLSCGQTRMAVLVFPACLTVLLPLVTGHKAVGGWTEQALW